MSNEFLIRSMHFLIGCVTGGLLTWAVFGDYKPPRGGDSGWRIR